MSKAKTKKEKKETIPIRRRPLKQNQLNGSFFSKFNVVCQFLGNNVKFSEKAPDSKFKDFNAVCPKKDNYFKNRENPWLPKSKRYTMFVGVSYIVMAGLHSCLVKLKCYNLDCYNHDSTIR